MARARFQEGTLKVEGKKPQYVVRFRVYKSDGTSTRKKVVIGPVSGMSKRAASQRKATIIAEQTSQLPEIIAANDRSTATFESFYRERFLPLKSNWSEPHRESFTYIMERFVLPKFGSLPIASIDKVMVQARLNTLANYSQSTLKHVRTKMVEVFEEAVEQEYLNRNPAKRSVIPSAARQPDQPILTEGQLIGVIDKLTDARDKAIFLVGTFCAMRTSEVFGLPWKNLHVSDEDGESYFVVDQIAYRGERHQRTKNDASKARVPIAGRTLQAVLQWQKECSDTEPNALMFPSTNKNGRARVGAPMYPATWLQKRLQPVAREVGIEFKVNFRATRRTASSLIQGGGAALATAQSLLRHASPGTTANVYSKPVPDSVKVAVNAYEDRVYAARKKPSGPMLVK